VKLLANHQDNEKNQIYLSTDDTLLSLLPGEVKFRSGSESTRKRNSVPGAGKQELKLHFSWLSPDGGEFLAPSAKIIYYLQYPELRFSGFLKGCLNSPRALRRDFQEEYGRRAVVIGVRGDQTVGIVITDDDGPRLIDELSSLPRFGFGGTLKNLMLERSRILDPNPVVEELRKVSGIWHDACFLPPGESEPLPRRARQGAGWTLEALLGIPMNSSSGPDHSGFELKSFQASGKVSVITSEPDFGWRREHGLKEYLEGFGRPSRFDERKLVFNGEHIAWKVNLQTGSKLVIEHWDSIRNAPDGTGIPSVLLVHEASETVLAGWDFTTLASRWSKKHMGCIYLEYERAPDHGLAERYRFGPTAYIGQCTSINRLLKALASGVVYLDPGDSLSASGELHSRMQWRSRGVRGRSLLEGLATLYDNFTTVELCPQAPIAHDGP
jgi:hypothetical protein